MTLEAWAAAAVVEEIFAVVLPSLFDVAVVVVESVVGFACLETVSAAFDASEQGTVVYVLAALPSCPRHFQTFQVEVFV